MFRKGKKPEESTIPKVKKEKKPFAIKNMTWARSVRAVMWFMLIFLFLKGVLVTLQPTSEQQINQTIHNFKQEFAEFKGDNEEIMAFAANFAKEYLTYYESDQEGYSKRIRPYVADRIYTMPDIADIQGNAKAIYVQAYKKEQYSEKQYDVYVLAEVNYDGKMTDTTILKVPIYASGGAYIVEGLPLFVTDSMLMADYKQAPYNGTAVSEAESVSLQVSVNNFFKAYYEDKAEVIEYYLAKSADRNKFTGLYKRYRFTKLNDLKCYRESGSEDIICIARISITDNDNETTLLQELNLTIVNENGRYYIKDINTKIGNLNE